MAPCVCPAAPYADVVYGVACAGARLLATAGGFTLPHLTTVPTPCLFASVELVLRRPHPGADRGRRTLTLHPEGQPGRRHLLRRAGPHSPARPRPPGGTGAGRRRQTARLPADRRPRPPMTRLPPASWFSARIRTGRCRSRGHHPDRRRQRCAARRRRPAQELLLLHAT